MDLEHEEQRMEMQAKNAPEPEGNAGGATSGNAKQGGTKGSQTLPTPLRPGKHKG